MELKQGFVYAPAPTRGHPPPRSRTRHLRRTARCCCPALGPLPPRHRPPLPRPRLRPASPAASPRTRAAAGVAPTWAPSWAGCWAPWQSLWLQAWPTGSAGARAVPGGRASLVVRLGLRRPGRPGGPAGGHPAIWCHVRCAGRAAALVPAPRVPMPQPLWWWSAAAA